MTSIREKVAAREIAIIVVVLFAATALHLVLLDPEFNGPDARSNFVFAVDGQDWSYWLDPDAFLQYLFPMGYGSFLAVVTKVSGGSFLLVQIIQIAMGLSMAVMGWFLTRNISRSVRVATLVVVAFSPAVLWLSLNNGYEILISFFMMFSVSLLWGYGGTPPSGRSFFIRILPSLAGISMGLGMLSQGKIIVIMPVLAYLAWRWGRGQMIAFIGFSAVLPLLWGIRNYFVLGRWNPFNSSSEVVIWMGNNWTTKTGDYVQKPPPLPPGFSNFYEASAYFVVSQPERAYELLLFRMARLLQPSYLYPDFGSLKGANIALHFSLIAISVIAILIFAAYIFGRLWTSPPAIPSVGPLAVLVMLFVLVHIPFATEIRHLQPIVPIALCVVVPTAAILFSRIKSSQVNNRRNMKQSLEAIE